MAPGLPLPLDPPPPAHRPLPDRSARDFPTAVSCPHGPRRLDTGRAALDTDM
jgi:hypothetical protein